MAHSRTVHLALGALLRPCTMRGTGGYTYCRIWQVPPALLSLRILPGCERTAALLRSSEIERRCVAGFGAPPGPADGSVHLVDARWLVDSVSR